MKWVFDIEVRSERGKMRRREDRDWGFGVCDSVGGRGWERRRRVYERLGLGGREATWLGRERGGGSGAGSVFELQSGDTFLTWE
ncbi:hypothetical protein Droror1_Dr00022537 [Drosera rotundifolia]